MKERPILFSAPMVRAILEGRKTMTRRVVDSSWQGFENVMPLPAVVEIASGGTMDFPGARPGDQLFYTDMPILDGAWQPVGCPYGQPGDRLWVRETWAYHGTCACYRADGWEGPPDVGYEVTPPLRWRPSIFMPRWASRITLEIISVRVERLEDISQDDAVREGCDDTRDMVPAPGRIFYSGGPRGAFMKLWESINGPLSWDSNPWVWVVEFKRIEP